jgi:dTDP-4-dehydrorhamnose reductase
VVATQLLAETCSARGIVLVYISTDYVFPGVPGEAPYSHDSPTNPPNFYGETKLAGEQAVLSCGGVVLRVPVLYGEVERNGESAVNTLLDVVWNREGKTDMEMDAWSIRYPTNTEDVARVLKDIAEKYKNGIEGLPKVLQFSSEDRMTKWVTHGGRVRAYGANKSV